MSKECTGCTLMKPLEDFRLHKRGNRLAKCNDCERAYQRDWYAKGGERTKAVKRRYMAKQWAENPEKMRAYARSIYAVHKTKRSASLRNLRKKRFFWSKATKLRFEGRATYKDLASLWKNQRGRCALTGRKLDRTAQLDHILPRAKGGGDSISNLQWVCSEVNFAKRDLTDQEFVLLCGEVIRWSGERIALVARLQAEMSA